MQSNPRQSKSKRNRNLTATLILAAVLIALVILYPTNKPTRYELKIVALGGESMLARSTSQELGLGEILLIYGEDMIVEDVNGQIIEKAELSQSDEIQVEIASREKDLAHDRHLDPVVERIILLPDDSNEYV